MYINSPNMRSIRVLTEFQGIENWWPLPRSSCLAPFAADQLPGTLCRGPFAGFLWIFSVGNGLVASAAEQWPGGLCRRPVAWHPLPRIKYAQHWGSY